MPPPLESIVREPLAASLTSHSEDSPPIVINRLLIALLFHMWSRHLLLNWAFVIMDLYRVCTIIKLYIRLEKRTGWVKKILCLYVLCVIRYHKCLWQVFRWNGRSKLGKNASAYASSFQFVFYLISPTGRVSVFSMAVELYAIEKNPANLIINHFTFCETTEGPAKVTKIIVSKASAIFRIVILL